MFGHLFFLLVTNKLHKWGGLYLFFCWLIKHCVCAYIFFKFCFKFGKTANFAKTK